MDTYTEILCLMVKDCGTYGSLGLNPQPSGHWSDRCILAISTRRGNSTELYS